MNDLEILYQGLDKFHSGMYWYTPKDSVDMAFHEVKKKITKDLNVLEFHKLIAPFSYAITRRPHFEVIPTFEQYTNKVNASLKYIIEQLENQK